MSERTPDLCAAYGCPLMGVHGVSGKWYCCCHFNANPGLNDAITAELHRNKPLVDRAMALRRAGVAHGALENELVTLTKEIGQQRDLTTEMEAE
ncbi:hypothetical protein IAG25_35515 [Caballeronia sp. EK]|uniref:hypothetical protein n=1 Tax=Caballeronia sp. EK TaxID=2767469 RepID=UPI0016550DBC|nr:hypothetical protein [Caballeronia sp. EK]MBC8642116.1 hypothetical protein [Caballeronia sp. EK]